MAYSMIGWERSAPVRLDSALSPSAIRTRSIVGLGVPNAKSSGQKAISSASSSFAKSASFLLSVASYRHFCPSRHAEIATFFIPLIDKQQCVDPRTCQHSQYNTDEGPLAIFFVCLGVKSRKCRKSLITLCRNKCFNP